MGCTQSSKNCEVATDTLKYTSSTYYFRKSFHRNRISHESVSQPKKNYSEVFDSNLSVQSSTSYESFSVSNEGENKDEIFEPNYGVADDCGSNIPERLVLNHFQDSNNIYQKLYWRDVHRLPANKQQKPPKNIAQELKDLSEFNWYWGPMSSKEAEKELQGKPDGSFLVRDSANSRHILSVSFRSRGSCCHTRIQCRNKHFSFAANEDGKDSIIELFRKSMTASKEGVLFYSRRQKFHNIWYPVRLLYPVSRIIKVPSLKYLCRFVIRRNTRCDQIDELPLPKPIIKFLRGNYFREETN